MTEKMWSECSKQEHEDVNKLNRRIKKLQKFITLGYLTEEGTKYFQKELIKEVNRTEKRYRDGDSGKSV